MLYRENEEFKLMPFKALFTQHGEDHVSYIVEKAEMKAYEDMGHIDNLTFEDATYSDDQIARLREVSDYPANDYQSVSDYVMEGVIGKGSLIDMAKQKETVELSILELSEMMMGVIF